MTTPSSVAARSFWKLGGLSSWRLGRTVFEQIIADNVFGRAAELAFYFLFALFPLTFFMMTLFGLFASQSVELQNDLLSFFADFLPPAAFRLLASVAKLGRQGHFTGNPTNQALTADAAMDAERRLGV